MGAGMTAAVAAWQDVPVRPAATVLILRDSPDLQVLMLHRHPDTDFVPGAMLFPGGRVDDRDACAEWAGHCLGWENHAPEARGLRIAAVREVFEETGLVLTPDPLPADFASGDALLALRAGVEAGRVSLLDVLVGAGLRVDLDLLVPLSRWITPPVSHKRFDTHFFLARSPVGQQPLVDGREAVDLEWISPQEGLALERAKKRNILLPTRLNLQSICAARTSAEAVAIAARQSQAPVEPIVERTDGGIRIVIDPKHGFGRVTEDLPAPPKQA